MKKLNKKQLGIGALVLVVGLLLIGGRVQARIEQQYAPLSGVRIVLDPGHGGKDDGAKAVDAKEQEINLKIAQKLQVLLQEAGAEVILTREGAYDLASDGATNRKREDMEKRVAMINEIDNDLFLSIHLNAFPNTSIKGAQAFYQKDNEATKVLADTIQKNLNEVTNRKLVSKTGDFYILNNTDKIGVLVECGFISNPQDRSKLISDEYQETIAAVLYSSITEYFHILDS